MSEPDRCEQDRRMLLRRNRHNERWKAKSRVCTVCGKQFSATGRSPACSALCRKLLHTARASNPQHGNTKYRAGEKGRQVFVNRLRYVYGLSLEDYARMWHAQDGKCAVCSSLLKNGPGGVCVDHKHVPGYKQKSTDEKRALVRGLVCFFCNWKVLGIMERAGRHRCVPAIRYLGWAA